MTWEESERDFREQFEELTHLQARGSELSCHSIPLRVRNHLSEGMQISTLSHTKMAEEVATLRAVVFSVIEFMLGHSPNEAF
jgi:hypothetical protein